METVKIPKKEYKRLVSKAKAYDELAKNFFESVVEDPVENVVKDFKKSGLYSDDFIKDLENGLKKSTYYHSY